MGNQIMGMTILAQTKSSIPQHEVFFGTEDFRTQPPPKGDGVASNSSDSERLSERSKDERPCRACTDFHTWAKYRAHRNKESSSSSTTSSVPSDKDGTTIPEDKSATTTEDPDIDAILAQRAHLQCPPDKDELGRSTWSFLHTMAAYFPDEPSPIQQKEMSAFVKIFAKYYPCEHCAKDFQKS